MHTPDPIFPFELKQNICYLGKVQSKSETKIFGILEEDRRKHMYLLGKTGMGKSTFLENMIVQDIFNDKGLCFIDPHGDSSEYILKRIPERRIKDLVYFNPSDLEFPIGLNILEPTSGEDPYLVVSGLMQIFSHIWAGSWSSRMEYILSNTLFALLDVPGSTLLGVVRMLSDNDYKEYVVSQVKNPTVKNFWVKEYAAFNDKYRTEAVAPILNKIGQFFSSDITLNMMGQAVSTVNFREIMDNSKILIMNLSKGKVGEQAIGLIGSMIITKLQLAAMSRVNLAEADRKDFYLYVDEFQNFTTESFATILSEARKYRLALVLAHQYIKQLEESDNEKVKNAVFGNVGTMMTFAIGAEDAAKMELEFEPIFTGQNLVNLSKFQMALKLGIQGKPSAPFLAQTLAPILPNEIQSLEHAIDVSRQQWTKTREKAQEEIMAWMNAEFGDPEKKNKKKSQFSHIMGTPGPERPPKDNEGEATSTSDSRPPRSESNNSDSSFNRERPARNFDRGERGDRQSNSPTSRNPDRERTSNRDQVNNTRGDKRDERRNDRRRKDEERNKRPQNREQPSGNT
ncbi:MAG: type IV secretion system DNA-binding domain-containing protein, partial [Patescibacteria group bacterium]